MPVWESFTPDSQSRVAIWEITETLSELLSMLPADHPIVTESCTIKNENKRREFLASRLLVEWVCDQLKVSHTGMVKETNGKPYLQDAACHISITHTEKYCATFIHTGAKVGIDIEKIQPQLIRIASKFLSDKEKEQCGNDTEKLCRAWCAKETVYKLVAEKGISFKNDISLDFDTYVARNSGLDYIIRFKLFDDHVLAYTSQR